MRHNNPPQVHSVVAILLAFILLGSFSSSAFAQVGKGDASFTASNLVKIAGMEKHLAKAGKEISVYVINDPALASVLQGMVGQAVGEGKLATVKSGRTIPTERPDIIYIGNPDDFLFNPTMMKSFLDYTKENKILSVTHEAMLIYKGVALGIASQEGNPKFYLNLQASKDSGMDWNKAVIKLAETI